jgi:PBP1b-binding outer membrane lipoprotein LpoB
MPIRIIAIAGLSLLLAGCVTTTSKTGEVVSIKPTRAQMTAYAKTIVCKSFDPISYSKKMDTTITVEQIRKFNAALAAYGCVVVKK